MTFTIYFYFIHLDHEQSEIIARIYTPIEVVLIALLGEVVGIISNSRKEKSNTIPGVAITRDLKPYIF